VLEFQGVVGRFREAFWPEEIVKVEGSEWQERTEAVIMQAEKADTIMQALLSLEEAG